MQFVRSFLLVCLVLCSGISHAFAEETINHFTSDITIQKDGSLDVKETIVVRSEGQKIQHGIYRDFPTIYKDRYGNTVTVGFHVTQILLNGREEPYFIRDQSNGKRIYIGQESVTLPPGIYTYTIKYHTERQLGFFKDFDELYWNVTGNGWNFPIQDARATIHLPQDATTRQYAGYTGFQGNKGQDYTVDDQKNTITFSTTRPLAAFEGLTVAVSWPKGFVHEPTQTEKTTFFIRDNLSTVVPAIILLITILYYYQTWTQVGKDPAKGTIIPLFAPPKNLSPAASRYILSMGYDDKTFASAILNLAAKKYSRIQTDDGKNYILERQETDDDTSLSADEKILATNLWKTKKTISIGNTYNAGIRKARDIHQNQLEATYQKKTFSYNTKHLTLGILFSVIAIACIVIMSKEIAPTAFMCLWLGAWTIACLALFAFALSKWKAALSGGGKISSALGTTLFALPFFVGEVVGIFMMQQFTSIPNIILLFMIIAVNAVFTKLMQAPTIAGRKLMDEIEGFKLFLSVTEKHRFETLHPPDVTPELFEKYLPYAMALDVENQWNEKFADSVKQHPEYRHYQPFWYTRTKSFNAGTFSQGLASSISSASTPPSRSSGSRGGGFSGGGSGGGGGGGW